MALYDVSLKLRDDYEILKSSLNDNLLAPGREEDLAWRRYNDRLAMQMAERVMDETFSLRSIYIPLRAFYEREKTTGGFSRTDRFHLEKEQVVDIKTYMDTWLNTPEEHVRFISGGPGSGKSSFTRHFAAKHSGAGHFKVLHIPLHKLQFGSDLSVSIRAHLADLKLFPDGYDPLAVDDPRLLIIFDGLDELSATGSGASKAVVELVREVGQKAPSLNQSRIVKFLLTGRTSVVQCRLKYRDHWRAPD